MKTKIEQAFYTIQRAMIDDEPDQLGSYAHTWHCNIAMAVYDSFSEDDEIVMSKERMHQIGNAAATRFMKICFDVETTNELPNKKCK